MAMSPGNQAITGGTVLRSPAIQSPNFVAGVSGWIIRQDGSAEFNSGTFRGSIEVGSLTGAHFIVNNSATGDVIDVYNSSNHLVFSIDASGNLKSLPTSGNPFVEMTLGGIVFNNSTGFVSPDPPSVTAPDITSGATELQLYSGTPDGNINHASVLALFGGTSAAGAEARITQRGVSGDVVQLDTGNNVNNLTHRANYVLVTDANGEFNQAHGCLFTPVGGLVTQRASTPGFAGAPIHTVLGDNTFTSTNMGGQCWNVGAKFVNSSVNVFIELWG